VLLAVLVISAVLALVMAPPWVALGTLLGLVVVFEANPEAFLGFTSHFYGGGRFTPPMGLFVLLIFATMFELVRRGESLRLPGAFTYPSLFLLGCAVLGYVNGHFSGASRGAAFSQIQTVIYLGVMPFLVVTILRTRGAVRNFALAAAVLAIFKGFEGTAGYVMGKGMAFGDTTLTYLEPTANWLMLLFMLTLAVALIHRVPTARWARWATPVVLAAFLLSFRRSFWLGAILGLALVLIFATGRRGGRVLLPAVVVFAVAGVAAYAFVGSGNANNPVVARGKALSPSQIQLSTDDLYRVEERRNVLQSIKGSPIFGLGIGVPWVEHRPVSVAFSGQRQYTHFLPFWYWMKLGIFGLFAYLWLMATALYMSFFIWRRHPDGLHRAIGLAAFAGFAGLMVAETTASFTGVDLRFSMIVGAAFGWLAAARATMNDPPPTPAEKRLTVPIARGRQVLTTGIATVRTRGSAWGTTALALGLLLAGLITLALFASGVGGA
jgi:O-Antigen ligase